MNGIFCIKIKQLVLTGFLGMACAFAYAQHEFSISMLDVRQGLLSNFVTRTISDDKQFKYFATEAGISRYDGYGFHHYRPSNGQNGLGAENIETLFASRDGSIWIGTKTGGLSRLDVHSQRIDNWNDVFQRFSNRALRVISLADDADGNIWVGTWGMGCFKVNVASRKLVDHFPSSRPIYQMICDKRGTIWFTDGRNLCAYNNQQGTLQRYAINHTGYGLCEDTVRQRIWVCGNADRKACLSYYDQASDSVHEIQLNQKMHFLASLAIDKQNRLWLGSWGDGLFISNASLTAFEPVSTRGFGNASSNTNHQSITHIYIDKNGIAWLSTAYGGVLILYPNKGFSNLANNLQSDDRDYNVTAMADGDGGQLLTGSISRGLYNAGRPQASSFSKVESVRKARINQLYRHGKGWLVGTKEGLQYFPAGFSGTEQRYFLLEKITAILITPDNKLWLGSQQGGLRIMPFTDRPDTAHMQLYTENAKAPYHLGSGRINKILRDAAGRIWVATHNGVNLWDDSTGRFIMHEALFNNSMPSVIIHDILAIENHLYMATPNGLFKVLAGTNEKGQTTLKVLAKYDEAHGLVNQFVCALQKDRKGNIWLSTTTGISKLNTFTGAIHHFGRQDGVQINAFHITSSHADAAGNLFFGGDNGLVWFNPEKVVASYQQPTLVLTGLTINNQPVEVISDSGQQRTLDQAIQYTESISLGYARNHIAVQFAANDFLGTENISYSYRLLARDKEWILLGEKNEVNFTGLQPGNYQLQLRANRNNQGWGEVTNLDIHISYPPWLRWYAWLFYLVTVAAIAFAVRKMRMRQQNLQMQLQRVQFEKEKELEVNEAKINFFTNISHEFRTPLTLIMSPSEELMAKEDLSAADKNKVGLIRNNAQKLLRLINQLLDYRKSEHGLLRLRTHSEDLVKLMGELVDDFRPAAKLKNITVTLEANDRELLADIDRSQLEMAINNLMSNAIKFTPKNGSIWVRVTGNDQEAVIAIADNGPGIAPTHLDKIFNRFYQVQETGGQQGGSGIGLAFARNIVELHRGSLHVDSTLGQGATFTLTIPLHQQSEDSSVIDDESYFEWQEGELTEPFSAAAEPAADQRPQVLIIDDNDDIRTYLAGLLQADYHVLEADNGLAGHKAALRFMPDIIISDVMMPQMNGIELCRELKGNMATSHIPVVLLTAKASEINELKGLQTGADDYITKPFNPQIIQVRVKNMLDNRKKLVAWYQRKVRFEPETTEATAENLDEVFLQKAIELVNENIQNDALGIEMMVEHLFMSQSTLYRKIKSLTGLSLTGFIRAIRLKKAAQLILQTNQKMSDIAMEVGFNDYKYFKKSFQQQFECLPSDYREKHAATQLSPQA